MKKFSKILIFFLTLVIVLLPLLSFAQNDADWKGLVPCGKQTALDKSGNAYVVNPCGFPDFMKLINNVINFILFSLAIPVAAIMFAYAGFLLLTSGGSTEARGKAKNIFKNAVIGIIVSAAAWLIVKTVLVTLGYHDAAWIGL